MKKGDIVLVSFPFTDFSEIKNRSALVLVDNERDITVSFISTQLKWQDKTDVVLEPSKENGLKKQSLVRLSKLATIDKDLALGKLGQLEAKKILLIDYNLKKIFDID